MGYAEFERYANDRVEDMLDAYASARLDPAPAVLRRMRANVMHQAAAAASVEQAVDAIVGAPDRAPAKWRFGWFQGPLLRRAFALGFAATLTIGTSAAVLAAPPGSPFYNARLVLETALMPSVADLDARLAAYEEQFRDRIAEAEAAAEAGDMDALAAALTAYQTEVNAAVAEIGTDEARLARLEAVLQKHIAKLEALAARLPTEVARQNALQHAITASERAVARLQDRANHNQNAGPGGNNGGQSGGNTGNQNGGNNGGQNGGNNGGQNGGPGGTPSGGGQGAEDGDGPVAPDDQDRSEETGGDDSQ